MLQVWRSVSGGGGASFCLKVFVCLFVFLGFPGEEG